eukprot:629175-Amorphochlora_amoeboformis.AAC.1
MWLSGYLSPIPEKISFIRKSGIPGYYTRLPGFLGIARMDAKTGLAGPGQGKIPERKVNNQYRIINHDRDANAKGSKRDGDHYLLLSNLDSGGRNTVSASLFG